MFSRFKKRQRRNLDWRALELEPTGSEDFGPCPCCGDMSRTVWGFVHSAAETLAAYYVQWTLDNPNEGAHFDLIIGKWGDATSKRDRDAVSLEYRVVEGQGSFMVIDAASRPVAESELVGRCLGRRQVVGKPIGEEVFAIVDVILVNDERIEEVRNWSQANV